MPVDPAKHRVRREGKGKEDIGKEQVHAQVPEKRPGRLQQEHGAQRRPRGLEVQVFLYLLVGEQHAHQVRGRQVEGGYQVGAVNDHRGVGVAGPEVQVKRRRAPGQGRRPVKGPSGILPYAERGKEQGRQHIQRGFHRHGPKGAVGGAGFRQGLEHAGLAVDRAEDQVFQVKVKGGAVEIVPRPPGGEQGPGHKDHQEHEHGKGRPQPEKTADAVPQGMGVRQPALGDQVSPHEEEHDHAQLMHGDAGHIGGVHAQDHAHMPHKDRAGRRDADEREVVVPGFFPQSLRRGTLFAHISFFPFLTTKAAGSPPPAAPVFISNINLRL